MEKWLKKNLKWITIILLILYMFKNFQSCNRKMSLNIQEKNMTENCDSLQDILHNEINVLNVYVDSIAQENLTKKFMIQDLRSDLKIAGIKADEAQRRADAVQKTAESVRSNTTIEVRGVERDTSDIRNKNLKNDGKN